MKSKTSLYDNLPERGIFLSDLKRFWWVSALNSIFLLLNLPFYHLIQGSLADNEWTREMLIQTLKLTSGRSELQILLIYTVPVLLAVLLFKYLNSSRSAATIHSFPLSRTKLFLTHCLAGFILLLIPVIITGLALMGVQQFTAVQSIYSKTDIITWMGYTLLFAVLFFAGAVFTGMFTGNSATNVVFMYILLALPFGLYELIRYNLAELMFGYSNANLHQAFMESLPSYALLTGRIGEEYFSVVDFVGYIVLTAVILVLAVLAYRARKLETAGDVISFNFVKPLFKYGVTVCAMLMGGAYFASVSGGSLFAIALGYFLGSLLGYTIAEILIQKSFKIWRQAYKGYLFYSVLLLLALFAVQTDAFGYVNRIPDPGQVEKAYFGSNIYAWSEMMAGKQNEAVEQTKDTYYFEPEGGWSFKNPENIKNIISLHQQLVQQRQTEGRQQFIIYSLKNGRNIIRQYNIGEREFAAFLKPIYESKEYKEARFLVLKQNSNEVRMLEVRDTRTPKEPVILVSGEEISQFIEALRKDLSSATYEQMIFEKNNMPMVTITDVKDRSQRYLIKESYSFVNLWLEQKGYYKKCMLQPDEIKYVTLEKIKPDPDTANQRIEIRDPALINELLQKSGIYYYHYSPAEEVITVGFHVSDNTGPYQFQEYISKNETVSPQLMQYLEQFNRKKK